MKLSHRYRPKADRQLLRDLVQSAWEAYHAAQFPETEQAEVAEKLIVLLEQRFPPDDMAVLTKYGLASACTNVNVNIYDPDHQRWDYYMMLALPRSVLCPQGRAHFFVGGTLDRDDRLPVEFEPYFNRIMEARKAWQRESKFTPQQTDDGYPTWEQIAEQLPVTGQAIKEAANAIQVR